MMSTASSIASFWQRLVRLHDRINDCWVGDLISVTTTRAYVEPPHALRVKFLDAANDYRPAERLVRWPGYEGEIDLTEELQLPGKTDATEVYREALRRAYETIYRPDTYQVTQDGPVRVVTRGDQIAMSQDVLDKVQVTARVRDTQGFLIELDTDVEMDASENYALRYRRFEDEDDVIGVSVVIPVTTAPGFSNVLTAETATALPEIGDLVMFGIRTRETLQLRVTGVEAAQDMASLVRLVDAAPIIDELTDAAVIPPWSSRVGAEIDPALTLPATPRFLGVSTGVEGTDEAGVVAYLIGPGSSAIPVHSYRIQHRLQGTASWTRVMISAAAGGGELRQYKTGDLVEMRAFAVASSGRESAPTPVIRFEVGAEDVAIPRALDPDSISLTSLLGGALLQFAMTDDASTASVHIYRSMSPALDRSKDAVGRLDVEPRQTYSFALGDTTRKNMVRNGSFGSDTDWQAGNGWTISGGAARRDVAGAVGGLRQSIATTTGRWYRIGYTVAVSGGTLTVALSGPSEQTGGPRTTSGSYAERLQALTGTDELIFRADDAFSGQLDDVVAYLETDACLDQGTHYLWLEPQNADGVPGPVAGPFLCDIS